jgi:hypothetical protein
MARVVRFLQDDRARISRFNCGRPAQATRARERLWAARAGTDGIRFPAGPLSRYGVTRLDARRFGVGWKSRWHRAGPVWSPAFRRFNRETG